MARVAFIGLGNMGGGMAANLAKAGHEVMAFDLNKDALARAATAGCTIADSGETAVETAEAVITMLPAGTHVADVYRKNVLLNAPTEAILIDCSTIDVATAKAIAGARLAEIPGMGHDLPRDAWPQIIDAIAENAARGTDDA